MTTSDRVDVIGPLKGGWYAIKEGDVLSQARFSDKNSAWSAWNEYRTVVAPKPQRPGAVVRRR